MRVIAVIVVALCIGATDASAQGGFIPPASKELVAQIQQKDKELFDAVFETCDVAVLSRLVTDDFEFYHDKFGKTASSGTQFLKDFGDMCERQRKGTDYRARRELDSASVKVYPINNYGAIHMGLHRFYKKLPDGKEQLVEVSQFTDLWKNENGSWKLARVLSYDHRDAR